MIGKCDPKGHGKKLKIFTRNNRSKFMSRKTRQREQKISTRNTLNLNVNFYIQSVSDWFFIALMANKYYQLGLRNQ